MNNRHISEHDRMGIAIKLLGGTALQWFVNLKAQQQGPASWADFKQKLLKNFQPVNNQELLRQQLFRLRQDRSVHEYIQSFRVLTGHIEGMDELTQVMLFINGLTNNYGMYVCSKHPKTVNDAVLEATTFETLIAANPSNSVRFPSLFASANVEFNAINFRPVSRSQHLSTTTAPVSKEDCFKLGLCFYCKAPGHRALRCPKKPRSSQTATHPKRSMVDVPENTSTSFSTSRFSPNQNTLVSPPDRVLVHPNFRRVLLDQDSHPVSIDHRSNQSVSVRPESDCVHVNLDSRHVPVYSEESARNACIDASLVVSQSSQFQEIMSLLNSNQNPSSLLLLLQGSVTDHPARILLDCGVSHNFVAANFVASHQLITSNIPRVVVSVANGMESPVDRELKEFPLIIAEFVDTVPSAYVFDIPSSSNDDLILGLPWLFTNNPRIDWKWHTITLCKNNTAVVLHSIPLSSLTIICPPTDMETSLYLLNAKQLTRCQQVYLITVKMIDFFPSTTSSLVDQPLQSLLRQFSNVFPNDLHQLPPSRDIDHEIKLLEDTSPPVQQPYRMSPIELHELKHQLEQLLSKGFIRPSNSPYGAPFLSQRKGQIPPHVCRLPCPEQDYHQKQISHSTR